MIYSFPLQSFRQYSFCRRGECHRLKERYLRLTYSSNRIVCHKFSFSEFNPFLSLRSRHKQVMKMFHLSSVCDIIFSRNNNTLQSTRGGVANLFRPRIVICAVILSSTNKWNIEHGLLSLVINLFIKVAE